MFYIGLSAHPRRDAVDAAFARHAPGARLRWCPWDEDCADTIFLEIDTNSSEFGFVLNAQDYAGYDDYRLGLEIARDLSLALSCNTVCDGTDAGPSPSPGWCVVWVQGRPFLGDDYGSLFFDDSPELTAAERAQLGPIRILGPLEL